MSDGNMTFVDLLLEGEVDPVDIDDYIDLWHDGTDERPLSQFLGFTPEEYTLWAEKPASLNYILFARKNHLDLKDALKYQSELPIAARAGSRKDAEEVFNWLRKTGRI